MRATLVIPTLEEAASIAGVLRSFRAAAEAANRTTFAADPIDWELLVVDGDSKDGTGALATAEGARVIVERRRGYGRAYRTGFAAATGEVIATADGDGTYPVESIPDLVARLRAERIDFLSGDRLAALDRRAMTLRHRFGNWLLNRSAGLLFWREIRRLPGRRLADTQSGFWVFRRAVLAAVRLTQDGMALSEELKVETIRRGFRFVEVPIRYGERTGAPKLQSWQDGWGNLAFLVRMRFGRDRTPPEPPPAAR